MLRSMFSAISGLRAHQTKMDVTGNNIANVNTVGFKSSATVFQDTLSQVVRAGGQPAADRGGTNPAQIGLGVKLAGITTNWTNGAAQSTGRSTDFMIEGDGFFVTRGAGDQQLFTRAGSFDFDASGKLVTPDGSILQGWLAEADGTVNPNGPIRDLTVPYGQITAPRATASGVLQGNLPSDAVVDPPTVVQTKRTMFDAQGVAHDVVYTFTKAPEPNEWGLVISTPHPTDPEQPDVEFATTTVRFAADDSTMQAPVGTDPDATIGLVTFNPGANPLFPAWANDVTIDLRDVSQFGGENTVTATEQDGFALGSLQSFTLSNDGTITGVYSNGLRQPLGQLALASFNNPSGLEKAGNSSFRVGDNSGVAMIGQAGIGGRGELSSGALEMSNVDLSEEFTGLIIAQRGFQANSRVITASDELLQDLVNLKR